MTPYFSIGKSLFKLAYNIEAMISVEIGEPSLRVSRYTEDTNSQSKQEEANFSGEVQKLA